MPLIFNRYDPAREARKVLDRASSEIADTTFVERQEVARRWHPHCQWLRDGLFMALGPRYNLMQAEKLVTKAREELEEYQKYCESTGNAHVGLYDYKLTAKEYAYRSALAEVERSKEMSHTMDERYVNAFCLDYQQRQQFPFLNE